MTDEVPKVFNWVKARCECSLPHIFQVLAEVVDSDVKEIQARKPDVAFKINKPTDGDKFIVAKTWNSSGVPQAESIAFELTPQGIAIKDVRSRKELFTAVPEISESGDCMLRIEGEPNILEPWQVSRKALENLFFGQ